ncbi:MAG TPA: DUF2339 domain-containing protein, partial [Deltaproteobacteria bacterium]|nr:DUF2339 domain-containing protein [Deltaproteobacteria bacterium]
MRSNPASDESTGSSAVGPILFGVVGMALGAVAAESLWGVLSGGALGFLYANQRTLRARMAALQHRVSAPEAYAPLEAPEPERPASDAVPGRPADLSDGGVREEAVGDAPSLEDAVSAAFAQRRASGVPLPGSSPASSPSPSGSDRGSVGESASSSMPPGRAGVSAPAIVDRAIRTVRDFFLGGNTVVRVGLLVLLVGIALLAKYAAENALLPVEVRLGVAALVGLALVGLGFRLRVARPGFGKSLQGGGVAALYLVTFFAFRVYGLLPAGFAFGLFLALALATAVLAHLQASEALLVIGSLGGFLAPVLASTGGGSHVALFSYYLILVVSTALVAWRRTWRIPALVAFVCTYAVATTWGVLRYEPEFLASTEPFVIAFMLLFTAIAILHAWQRPPHLRGFVDGTLVFGTPFVSILLEGALVRERELGLALAAAGFGLFYAGTGLFVWRFGSRELRPLAEAFIALAIGFATMAVPFAFEGSLTIAVAWALEGAGLYWIGARQARGLPRLAGVGLQGLAALAFLTLLAFGDLDPGGDLPILNGRALSCLSMAGAGIFIARQAWVARAALGRLEAGLAWGFGVWGLSWWTAGSLGEIDRFVPDTYAPSAWVLWLSASTFLLELGSARWDWRPGRMMTLVSLPGAILLFFVFLDAVPHLL